MSRLTYVRRHLRVRLEDGKEFSIGDVDFRPRPKAREIEKTSIGVYERDGIDLDQTAGARLEHLMNVFTRHAARIVLARSDPQRLYLLQYAALHQINPLKRSVDLFRKYQRGVFEFALAVEQ